MNFIRKFIILIKYLIIKINNQKIKIIINYYNTNKNIKYNDRLYK